MNTPNAAGALNARNASTALKAFAPDVPDMPGALNALIGQPVAHIDTPAAVVDLDAMERNIARMADFARQHRVRWRPHAKLHKSAALALQLQRAGACGACVQKTSEAEALAAGGVLDIFISNEVIDPAKLRRVARLAARLAAAGGQLALAVDSSEGIARLAAAMAEAGGGASIDVFVESTWARTAAACRPAPRPPRWRMPWPRTHRPCVLPGCRPTTAARSTSSPAPHAAPPLTPWCRRLSTPAT